MVVELKPFMVRVNSGDAFWAPMAGELPGLSRPKLSCLGRLHSFPSQVCL